MKFFKSVKAQKLADPAFRAFYARECHICALTLKVIEQVEAAGNKSRILACLDIDLKAYEDLKEGDFCRPEQVMRLCRYLGIKTGDMPPCPRLKHPIK
ncbi:MAG: hypothetical protein HUN04_11580 [Desulfobacter sp.]|nr:MAG: hypothetical protein HUN04_11580 [Desulfobacter sp.]